MDTVVLYTTHCPKCNVLAQKLKQKNIKFDVVEGAEPIGELGFSSAPILKVNDTCYEFGDAVNWINGR